jgi:hypothetical protein
LATSKKCRSRAVSYPAWRARRTDLSLTRAVFATVDWLQFWELAK